MSNVGRVSDAANGKYSVAFADSIWEPHVEPCSGTLVCSFPVKGCFQHKLIMQSQGMYPALIIILAKSQKSCLDQTIISTQIDSIHLDSATIYASPAAGPRNLSTSHISHTNTHIMWIGIDETREMGSVPGRAGSIADENTESQYGEPDSTV